MAKEAKRPNVSDGDVIEVAGRRFKVSIERDDNDDAPWDNEDGHGPVSDWVDRTTKRPGQRILWREDRGRRHVRFYDVEEATKIAKRDGWGCPHCKLENDKLVHPHKTTGEMRACAVEADFDRLRRWCNDDWFYVGVRVQEIDDEDEDIGDDQSLWGIESDDEDYITETAYDLAGKIIADGESEAEEAAERQEELEASVEGLGLA